MLLRIFPVGFDGHRRNYFSVNTQKTVATGVAFQVILYLLKAKYSIIFLTWNA